MICVYYQQICFHQFLLYTQRSGMYEIKSIYLLFRVSLGLVRFVHTYNESTLKSGQTLKHNITIKCNTIQKNDRKKSIGEELELKLYLTFVTVIQWLRFWSLFGCRDQSMAQKICEQRFMAIIMKLLYSVHSQYKRL